MSFSLYDAVVPSYLQFLTSLDGILGKAEAHCAEQGVEPETIIAARLAPDMLPFAYQVKPAGTHSIGAIEGVRNGSFSPYSAASPDSFQALRAHLGDAIAALSAIDHAEIDGFVGRDMRFVTRSHEALYDAEDFLLSFSLPNFYFHVTTAYDILRWQGVAIGKRDYLGQPRTKPK